ncbi:MAG: hypothetical protein KatS3mg009_1422 [Acidimicrobiia bacterium]|nr:MAG: hypothetical protein KatS3mg009_1422 [Acidimicrobiia bacterium]
MPESVSTPLPAFQMPVIPSWSVNASSSSPATNPAVTPTAALVITSSPSRSVIVSAGSIAVAGSFSVYASGVPVVTIAGGAAAPSAAMSR